MVRCVFDGCGDEAEYRVTFSLVKASVVMKLCYHHAKQSYERSSLIEGMKEDDV